MIPVQGHLVELFGAHTQAVGLDIELSQGNISVLGMTVAPLGCSQKSSIHLMSFSPQSLSAMLGLMGFAAWSLHC